MIGTLPRVFIVESNQWEDEDEKRREGLALSEILALSRKPVEYRYIRTEKELRSVLGQFTESRYRYLHIASHGYGDGFSLTLDNIDFRNFVELLSDHIDERRLFVSACDCVKLALAKPLLRYTHCYSVVGPRGDITFRDAAVVWASFYSLMFKRNPKSMRSTEITNALSEICRIFDVRFNAYFRRSEPYYRYQLLGRRPRTSANGKNKE